MEAYFSADVVEGLRTAREKNASRRARFCVHVDGAVFPILRLSDTGFEVSSEKTPHLRGHADIFDGPSHLWQCLILRAEKGAHTTRYEFKRQTRADGRVPRDYADKTDAPAGYLPKE